MDRFLYCLKAAYFFFWRAWFAVSSSALKFSMRRGFPDWLSNAVGRVFGIRYAWAMMRLVWDPSAYYEKLEEQERRERLARSGFES